MPAGHNRLHIEDMRVIRAKTHSSRDMFDGVSGSPSQTLAQPLKSHAIAKLGLSPRLELLALQLRFLFELCALDMGEASIGLMGSTPE